MAKARRLAEERRAAEEAAAAAAAEAALAEAPRPAGRIRKPRRGVFYSAIYPSVELGPIHLASNGMSLVGVWLPKKDWFSDTPPRKVLADNSMRVFLQTKDWLERYFAGERPPIAELPLALDDTDFRQRVWLKLIAIPYGQVRTYGQIARELAAEDGKDSMATSAVSAAVAHNPLSIVIPCHRVVGAGGKLGSYPGGIENKIRLLEHEGVDLSAFDLLAEEEPVPEDPAAEEAAEEKLTVAVAEEVPAEEGAESAPAAEAAEAKGVVEGEAAAEAVDAEGATKTADAADAGEPEAAPEATGTAGADGAAESAEAAEEVPAKAKKAKAVEVSAAEEAPAEEPPAKAKAKKAKADEALAVEAEPEASAEGSEAAPKKPKAKAAKAKADAVDGSEEAVDATDAASANEGAADVETADADATAPEASAPSPEAPASLAETPAERPWIDEYLRAKPGCTKDWKAEWEWWRYQVGDKLFAATMVVGPERAPEYAGRSLISLKCDPVWSERLREDHEGILPGFYADKRRWISVDLNSDVTDDLLRELIDHSYDLVFSKLTKKLQRQIAEQDA